LVGGMLMQDQMLEWVLASAAMRIVNNFSIGDL
jgi:hypothetical protein